MNEIANQKQGERNQKNFQKDMLQCWDAPDREQKICRHFGCCTELTSLEAMAGNYCTKHSKSQNDMQPYGVNDPILFVSY